MFPKEGFSEGWKRKESLTKADNLWTFVAYVLFSDGLYELLKFY